MRGPRPTPIELTIEEKTFLEKVTRTRTLSQQEGLRARIILLSARGEANAQIARHLEIEENTVRKWRKRFLKDRLRGLRDLPRNGAPSAFSPS